MSYTTTETATPEQMHTQKHTPFADTEHFSVLISLSECVRGLTDNTWMELDFVLSILVNDVNTAKKKIQHEGLLDDQGKPDKFLAKHHFFIEGRTFGIRLVLKQQNPKLQFLSVLKEYRCSDISLSTASSAIRSE
jgi:hypothetical protein